MKKHFYLGIVTVCILLGACAGPSSAIEEFHFGNLLIRYPDTCEISQVEENSELRFISFFLSEKKDPDSRIEWGISEFDPGFLQQVPREERLGELVADVAELQEKLSQLPGVEILQKSDIELSQPPSRPEAYAFVTLQRPGEEKPEYLVLSSLLVDNYNVVTVSKSAHPQSIELFSGILENLTTQITKTQTHEKQ